MVVKMGYNFEKLKVYQAAVEFVKQVYKITEKFPKDEQFGIISQIRRASVSIIANIAEGSGRFHKKDFKQFLRISRSSCYEAVALLDLSRQIGYINAEEYKLLYDCSEEISKMINGLINSLKEENKS
jgi:four helix bundle protein